MADDWQAPVLDARRTGDASCELELELKESSPWFDGHFPTRPILPGVGMLALAVQAASWGLQRPLGLREVKKVRFKGVVSPGERLLYRVHWTGEDSLFKIRFEIHRREESIGAGQLVLQGD